MAQLTPFNQRLFVGRATRILQDVARSRLTTTYEELMEKMGGPGRGFVGGVLVEVCSQEHAAGRPLLTAIVVKKGSNDPGEGYWMLPMVPKVDDVDERRKLVEAEQQRVWDYWQKQSAG